MSEILFVIFLAGGFLIPPLIFKQYRLFWVFAIFFACFGVCEMLSIMQTGMSISQHFWVFDKINPIGGWIVVGGMAIGWLALLWHFKGKKKE